MRLELESNVTPFPVIENVRFDEPAHSPDFQDQLKSGIVAAQKGDRDQARTLLVNAAQQEPRSEDAWMWLASISEYPEELLAFLNNVLNINPDNKRAQEWRSATCSLLAKTFVQRGVTAHGLGSASQAAQFFDQALVYDYDCEMAWFWKASLSATDEQKEEFLRRTLSINAGNHAAQAALEALSRPHHAISAVEDAKASAEEMFAPAEDGIHQSMPKGRIILIVDDSPTVRKLISGKLEKSGHTVVCAEDGVEGMARIAERIPDLVLLDITMPRMDGYEVCRQIRANPASKDVPVVMISDKDGFFDEVRGSIAGSTGYITKPFGPETLMKALEAFLVQDSVQVG